MPKERFSGQYEDPQTYESNEGTHYADKGSHKLRTLGNDHRKHGHREHWKKEEKKHHE